MKIIKTKILNLLNKYYSPAKVPMICDESKVFTDSFKLFKNLDLQKFDNNKKIYEEKLDLNSKNQKNKKYFPENWKTGDESLKLITLILDHIDFNAFVETGVANGISTNLILSKINSPNKLISFDIDEKASKSVKNKSYLRRWQFNLLSRNFHISKKQLRKIIFHELNFRKPKVLFWYHDSDHSYKWVRFEFNLIVETLKKGLSKKLFFICDDIDSSSAWIEIIKDIKKQSNFAYQHSVLFDSRKFLGVLILTI